MNATKKLAGFYRLYQWSSKKTDSVIVTIKSYRLQVHQGLQIHLIFKYVVPSMPLLALSSIGGPPNLSAVSSSVSLFFCPFKLFISPIKLSTEESASEINFLPTSRLSSRCEKVDLSDNPLRDNSDLLLPLSPDPFISQLSSLVYYGNAMQTFGWQILVYDVFEDTNESLKWPIDINDRFLVSICWRLSCKKSVTLWFRFSDFLSHREMKIKTELSSTPKSAILQIEVFCAHANIFAPKVVERSRWNEKTSCEASKKNEQLVDYFLHKRTSKIRIREKSLARSNTII